MIRPLPAAGALAIAAACGGPSPSEEVPSAAAPVAGAMSTRSPCALLTADEVATGLGPLAGVPYRAFGTVPDAGGDICRYETADLRSLVVTVTWENGAEEISLLNLVSSIVADGGSGELRLIDGTLLAGEWDEARVLNCCELKALRGDQLVTIDVGGTRLGIAGAAKLADIALRRLEQPLEIDDAANAAAALARDAARPRRRSVCSLLDRAAAEAAADTALGAEPAGDESSCTYTVPLGPFGQTLDVTLAVSWRDGFREMTTITDTVGRTSSLIGLPEDTAAEAPGPWDEFSRSIIGVMAVKRDVLISVESGPFGQDVAEAMIAQAIENLDD